MNIPDTPDKAILRQRPKQQSVNRKLDFNLEQIQDETNDDELENISLSNLEKKLLEGIDINASKPSIENKFVGSRIKRAQSWSVSSSWKSRLEPHVRILPSYSNYTHNTILLL
jgi:hypothetical protein